MKDPQQREHSERENWARFLAARQRFWTDGRPRPPLDDQNARMLNLITKFPHPVVLREVCLLFGAVAIRQYRRFRSSRKLIRVLSTEEMIEKLEKSFGKFESN